MTVHSSPGEQIPSFSFLSCRPGFRGPRRDQKPGKTKVSSFFPPSIFPGFPRYLGKVTGKFPRLNSHVGRVRPMLVQSFCACSAIFCEHLGREFRRGFAGIWFTRPAFFGFRSCVCHTWPPGGIRQDNCVRLDLT